MDDYDRATRVKRELFLRSLVPGKPPAAVARQLVRLMRERSLSPGEVLYARGADATDAIFILDGKIELLAEGEPPSQLETGAVIGMIDCTIKRPRGRTAVAVSDVELLVIHADDWIDVFEENQGYARIVREALGRMMHQVVLELAPDGGYPPRALGPEEALEVGVLQGSTVDRLVALRSSTYFETAGVQSLCELATRGKVLRKDRGACIFRPGEAGERLFVVVSGLVEVERSLAPVVRASFGPGELVLGNVSLAGLLREYSMTARTDTLVLALEASDLDDVTEDHFDLAASIFRGFALDHDQMMTQKALVERGSPRPVADARA